MKTVANIFFTVVVALISSATYVEPSGRLALARRPPKVTSGRMQKPPLILTPVSIPILYVGTVGHVLSATLTTYAGFFNASIADF